MKVIITNHLTIREASQVERQRIEQKLTFENPNYIRYMRYGSNPYRRWLPCNIPKLLKRYWYWEGQLIVPRGFLTELYKIAEGDIEIEDNRANCPATMTFSGQLRANQEEPVDIVTQKLITHSQGIFQSPCSSGKTVMTLDIIARIGQKTLVVVGTKALLRQWVKAVKQWLGITPSVVQEKKRQLDGPIVIAMAQTLINMGLSELANMFGFVILDEAHHVPAKMFRGVIGKLSPRYIFGVTATPERSDGLGFDLGLYLGAVLHEISREEIDSVPTTVIKRLTGVSHDFGTTYHEKLKAILDNQERNRQIANSIEQEVDAGHIVLVLSERLEHLNILNGMVRAGIKTAIITGANSDAAREKILDQVRSGEIKVLFSVKIAEEGLDLPILSRLILAFPGKNNKKITQVVGRITRTAPGKSDAVVIDFCDETRLGRDHWKIREKVYADLGITIKEESLSAHPPSVSAA
jgi:superfamily II DNA or RNA helicase